MIKQARMNKNMSQEDLASELGVSRQAVSKWESDRAIPTGANREVINSILDISIGRDEGKKKSRKYKVAMIMGWTLAVIMTIVVIMLAVDLYNTKNRLSEAEKKLSDFYKVQLEADIIEEQIDTEAIPGMDANDDSIYQEFGNLEEQADSESTAGTDSNGDTTFVQE